MGEEGQIYRRLSINGKLKRVIEKEGQRISYSQHETQLS